MKGTSIAGRKPFDKSDFYETPAWAVKQLLARETFDGIILEPACGYGAISEVLKEYEYTVISQDIEARGYGDVLDFFKQSQEVPNIITNPPFSHALEFVQWSKVIATQKIAMILKLTFLESAKRYDMFNDEDYPLARVYVFSNRVNMYAPDHPPVSKNGGTIAYAWFVWEKGHIGQPQIHWIRERATP